MLKKISQKTAELGVLMAVMKRSYGRRIPRLMRIKEAVDNGEKLTDYQINFLSKALRDAAGMEPHFNRHPELQAIATKTVSLYHDITEQALENEQAGAGAPGSRATASQTARDRKPKA